MKPLRFERNLLFGAAIAVCLVILATAAFAVLKLRDGVLERTSSTTQNLAVSVQQTLEGLVDMIDVGLLASADEIERQSSSGQANKAAISNFLELQTTRLPHVAFVRATDAAGNVLYGAGIPQNVVNLAERDFFIRLKDDPDAGLHISKPMMGKIAAAPVVTFARRISRPDGTFVGTVHAAIYVDEFSKILAQIKMRDGGSLSLRDKDLGLIARHVFGGQSRIPMGSTQLSKAFAEALQRNPLAGSYLSDAQSLDPEPRIYSYQRSQKYQFLAIVGIPVGMAFAEWQRQAVVVLGLASLLVVAVLFLVYQTDRSRSRLQALVSSLEASRSELEINHLQLAKTEEQHLSLLKNLHLGVVVHASGGSILFSNAQASALLGLSEAQMLGKMPMDPAWRFVDAQGAPFLPQDYPVSRVIRTRQAFEDVELGVQVSGTAPVVWLEVSAFPEFDADGSLKQVVVNFYEITKRRLAEQARERVARALRLVTDTNITLARSEDKTQLLADICALICEKGG
jgi:PAS domain S-box-containing protein